MSEKKNVAFYILEILKKYSSPEKRLTQNRIAELLQIEYGRICDLRTIKSGLDSLIRLGYNIKYETLTRNSDSRGRSLRTNWYIEKLFTSEESFAIMLSLYSSSAISQPVLESLTRKLEPFICDAEAFEHFTASLEEGDSYTQLRDNINTINTAINDNLMINFPYVSYFSEDKPCFEKDIFGRINEYLIKPLGITCANGKAHLYGEIGDTGKKRYFAIERIYSPKLTDIHFVPPSAKIPVFSNRLERKRASAGNRERAVILANDSILPEIFDLLGKGCRIISAYNGKTELEIMADLRILTPYILHFGSSIEVLSPTKLRRSVAIELRSANEKYLVAHKLRGYIT